MAYDDSKIDEAALALLFLTLHSEFRAWKAVDWEVMGRLHEKGWITNPVGKTKSVMFTDEGLEKAQLFAEKLFGKHG